MKDNTADSLKIVVGAALVLGVLTGISFGGPAFFRYQARQSAANDIAVNQIQIQSTNQLVEVEKKKAEIRVAQAHGIAESQRIIASSLTANYLQYLAIEAQEKMAGSANHTQIYIPSGNNGIPLVKTVDAP